MYAARNIILGLASALVAIAVMATPALAAHGTPVEAVNEAKAEQCDLGAQNCRIVFHSEAGSETFIVEHVMGFEMVHSACTEEFVLELAHDGSGHIVDQVMAGPNCAKQTCAGEEGEWPAHLAETGAGQETLEVRACFENLDGSGDIHCSYYAAVNTIGHQHFELTANDQPCHAMSGGSGTVEITGHWISEDADSDEVELIHL